jgi:hypothetical protein
MRAKFIAALFLAACTFVVCGADQKSNPTGTWKWTVTNPNGDPVQSILKLKVNGDKIAGTLTGRGGMEIPIQDATLNGDEISFRVVREFNDNKVMVKHAGKIAGDMIKGKIESNFNGQPRVRDWDARRESLAVPSLTANVTGTWRYAFAAPNGNTFEQTLELKQEGGKLTGLVHFNGNEAPISDARINGDEISLTLARERNGQKVLTKFNGKVFGDSIKGKMVSNFSGEEKTSDWDAKRQSTISTVGTITGNWRYSFTTPGGQTIEPRFKLLQEGEKISGSIFFSDNQLSLSDGTIKDGDVAFNVVRERDGEVFVAKYHAKVDGGTMKGTINSNWGGKEQNYEFEARRFRE